MATIPQTQLFEWHEIDSASDLDRLKLVLNALSLVDEDLVTHLEIRRGNGRDDYPIRATWNAVIAGLVFQHPHGESLRRELRRNAELRQLCGFDIFAGEAAVPTKDALSRFLVSLMDCEEHLSNMFHTLVDLLKEELPLAYEVTRASKNDSPRLMPLVEDVENNHPEIYAGIDELSADKGYDAARNNSMLYDNHQIKPVIDNRKMWKEDEVKTLFDDRYDVFCYDESGQVYCQCPSDAKEEDYVTALAFMGFEKDRQTLKFRCPAAYYDFVCPGREECEKLAPFGVGNGGRIVRVPLSFDRRIFTPIARISNNWQSAYNRRTAVERVNGRLDQVMGFEHHTIGGKQKMTMRMSLAFIVMLAMALGRIRIGQHEK